MSEIVIIIRPSFKKICGPDACRAALYNHILYRLARKAKDEPDAKVKRGEVFWYASAEDICKDIDEAWCVNKVRKELKVLVDAGLLGQRHNPIKGWDRKYQYFFGIEQGNVLRERCKEQNVCLLHIDVNSEVLHLLHMVNAFTKYGACICHKEEMDVPNMGDAFTISGRAIPEGSLRDQAKGSTEEESLRTASADAPHPPDALSAPLSFEDDAEETLPRLPAMPRPETASQHTSLALVQSPQQALPAVSAAPVTGHTGEQAAFGQRAPVAPGANVNTTPPHPEKPPTNPALPVVKPARKAKAEPADTPKGPPAMPTADMAWGTRKCQAWFDYWRGGIPISKYKLMQASTCAKGLAEQFDEATVIRIRGVMEADPYYVALGGCDICDVANNIRKYLKREQAHRPVAPDTAANATGRGPLVSLEQRQKNIDAAKARVAAKQAVVAPGRIMP